MPKKKDEWFTNINGAAQMLNRNPRTVGRYIRDGFIDGDVAFGNNTLIPISEVAKVMNTSESVLVKIAKVRDVPLWKRRR